MKELVEFRIPEKRARQLLRPDEGVLLGDSVRKLIVESGSLRFEQIGELGAAKGVRNRKHGLIKTLSANVGPSKMR